MDEGVANDSPELASVCGTSLCRWLPEGHYLFVNCFRSEQIDVGGCFKFQELTLKKEPDIESHIFVIAF